jgi:hypothetical protein
MTLRHSLAFELAALLAWNSIPTSATTLGVVVGADRAYPNSGAVSEGATVYDGDHFSTEAGGMLRLRGDAATLDLAEEGAVIVRCRANGAQGTEAELSKGTLTFSATRAAALEISALGTFTRPASDARTIGQVSITGPKELRIHARRGALQFSYRGETRIIAEGESYRVILDPPDDTTEKKQAAKKAGRPPKAFLFVIIGGGAAGAAVLVLDNQRQKNLESPDRP